MTLTESIDYISKAARELGYSYAEFTSVRDDLEEILYKLEDTDKESLNKIIEVYL